MKLSSAREKGIFKTTIYIGQFFEEEEEAVWITMREPSTDETTKFNTEDEAASLKALKEVFPACITDHNFENEEGNKAKKKEVFDFILESSALFGYVTQEWQNALPLANRIPGNSDK